VSLALGVRRRNRRCRLCGGLGGTHCLAVVRQERGGLNPIAKNQGEAKAKDPLQHVMILVAERTIGCDVHHGSV